MTRTGGRWLLPLAGAITGTAVWFLLVRLAIDFGQQALDGEELAWVYLGLAGLAAVVAALTVVVLARMVLVALGVVREYAPRRARR